MWHLLRLLAFALAPLTHLYASDVFWSTMPDSVLSCDNPDSTSTQPPKFPSRSFSYIQEGGCGIKEAERHFNQNPRCWLTKTEAFNRILKSAGSSDLGETDRGKQTTWQTVICTSFHWGKVNIFSVTLPLRASYFLVTDSQTSSSIASLSWDVHNRTLIHTHTQA